MKVLIGNGIGLRGSETRFFSNDTCITFMKYFEQQLSSPSSYSYFQVTFAFIVPLKVY